MGPPTLKLTNFCSKYFLEGFLGCLMAFTSCPIFFHMRLTFVFVFFGLSYVRSRMWCLSVHRAHT